MFGIGMSEMLIILAVALLVFGPTKLPEIAKSIAKGLKELRRAGDDLRSSVNFDLDDDKAQRRPLPRTPATTSPSPTAANTTPGAASLGASVPTEPAAIPGSELATADATAPAAAGAAAAPGTPSDDVWPKPASDTTARGSVLDDARDGDGDARDARDARDPHDGHAADETKVH